MAKTRKTIKAITHDDIRKNIPTAEYHAAMKNDERSPIQVAYERRNRDLDPQLVWRGKDEQDQTNLIAQAPPLYIQEKIHPKAIIDDLERHSRAGAQPDDVIDLFADFNGLPSEAARTEFYQHDANWSNRMILGDSLHVMASLAEREGLRGKVQCIYFDPPYGIKFNSNFQWSTTSRTVRDGNKKHITREPEQVKAFRDAWQDGVHSYLAYLRDRLLVARDLLADTGSVFVQIGDENVHRVRLLMDEVFGNDNCMSIITYKTSVGLGSQHLDNTTNHLVWYSKNKAEIKYRRLYRRLEPWKEGATRYKHVRMPDLRERRVTTEEIRSLVSLPTGARLFRDQGFTSRSGSATTRFSVEYRGRKYYPSVGGWRTSEIGMQRAIRADRALQTGSNISYRKYFDDFDAIRLDNFWNDVSGGITSRSDPKIYVVQTSTKIVQRCILMTTDPGDLVLDPTCGAGTTAYVAEQWGRRWITIDTSRVALALSRARIMGARYPYYLLADSPEGQQAEATVAHKAPSETATYRRIRQGFVYERVPRITLKRIANNTEIDVIWNASEEILEPLRVELNRVLEREWSEWDIPREPGDPWPPKAAACWNRLRKASTDPAKTVALRTLNQQLGRNYELNDVPDEPRDPWPSAAASLHTKWWEARVSRQRKIDASITASAPFEYLYDKPYDDKKTVRVAGPFTVESLSPHRLLAVDENDQLMDRVAEPSTVHYGESRDFAAVVLDNLHTAGVQQARKEDRITFSSLTGWPGEYICGEGRYRKRSRMYRAGILVGPEFGTVSRPDLAAAAKEAAEYGFDVLIACAFNYDAKSTEFTKFGRMPVLKARMNADLHMATDLKKTDKGNLFVVFGEPDIKLHNASDGQIEVEIKGVDVFHPATGEVRSDETDGIACWFIDTDYNEESFFVRHAYFLGAGTPYKGLKTSLKSEINQEAWASLHRNVSRPFARPQSGRIAVKVINHLGDEVMKVFRVS